MGNGEQSSTGHIWPSWRRHLGRSVISSSRHLDSAWSILRAHDYLQSSNTSFPRFSAAWGKPLSWCLSDCSHVFSTELSSAAFNRRWTRVFARIAAAFISSAAQRKVCRAPRGVCDVYRGKVSHVSSGVSLQMLTFGFDGTLKKPLWGALKVNLVEARRMETLPRRPVGRTHSDSNKGRSLGALVTRFVAFLLVSILKFNLKRIWSCAWVAQWYRG